MHSSRGFGNRAPSSFQVIKHEKATEVTMRIRLNIDYTVALDGIHVSSFPAGAEVDFPERIAVVLVADGRASLPVEGKMLDGAPENKMLDGADKNKGFFKRGGRKRS
jgi:hypothetical protein